MKSDKTTVQKRVEEVLELRLLGAEFMEIRQHASASGWNVCDRQLRRYISAGDDYLAKNLEKDRDRNFNRAIAERRALYTRAVAASNISDARQLLKDIAELQNLYPPKTVAVTGKGGAPIVLQIVEEIVDPKTTGTLGHIEEEVVTK